MKALTSIKDLIQDGMQTWIELDGAIISKNLYEEKKADKDDTVL